MSPGSSQWSAIFSAARFTQGRQVLCSSARWSLTGPTVSVALADPEISPVAGRGASRTTAARSSRARAARATRLQKGSASRAAAATEKSRREALQSRSLRFPVDKCCAQPNMNVCSERMFRSSRGCLPAARWRMLTEMAIRSGSGRSQAREKILKAAVVTLAAQGFSRTTARAVAIAGGFAPGVIYLPLREPG